MGLIGTIGAIVIGVIAFIVIAAIVIFLVTFFAPVLIALIILAILIGVGYWIYGKIKTKKQAFERLVELAKYETVTVLCYKGDGLNCHRFILKELVLYYIILYWCYIFARSITPPFLETIATELVGDATSEHIFN